MFGQSDFFVYLCHMKMMSIKGHIVDVKRREVFDGELVIDGETIAEVKRC